MSSISRSLNLVARTSRSSLLRPTAINPVHHVFSNKVAGRGLATAFERNKPHVNIGMTVLIAHNQDPMLKLFSRYHWPRRSRQGKQLSAISSDQLNLTRLQ